MRRARGRVGPPPARARAKTAAPGRPAAVRDGKSGSPSLARWADNDEGAVGAARHQPKAHPAGHVLFSLAGDIDVAPLARRGEILSRIAVHTPQDAATLGRVSPQRRLQGRRLKTLEIRGRAGIGRFADARLEAQELITATRESPVDVHFGRNVEHIRT